MPASDFQKEVVRTLAAGWAALGDTSRHITGSFALFFDAGREPEDLDVCYGPTLLSSAGEKDIKILRQAGYVIEHGRVSKNGQTLRLHWTEALSPKNIHVVHHPEYGYMATRQSVAACKFYMFLQGLVREKDLYDLLWLHEHGTRLPEVFHDALRLSGLTREDAIQQLKDRAQDYQKALRRYPNNFIDHTEKMLNLLNNLLAAVSCEMAEVKAAAPSAPSRLTLRQRARRIVDLVF